MSSINNLLFLLIGLLSGGFIGWLFTKLAVATKKGDEESLDIKLKLEMDRSSSLMKDIQELNQNLIEERKEILNLNNENSTLKANYINIQERLEEQKEYVSRIQEKFSLEFKHLANEIFEEKSKKFTDQNKVNLSEILSPLGEKLTQFERKVEQTHKENIERSSALREQISGLKELNDRMTKETSNLTKALKGDVKTQGNWGEVILERILEVSGLQKDREYFVQETIQTEEGRRLRPDVIVRLPEKKYVIVDAKVSLTAYEKYANTEDESEKREFLKSHFISIKNHINGLAEKNYHKLFEEESPDYILMFIPIEPAFALLYQKGENLYNQAHEKNIIIVSPTTLLATLKTVSGMWRNEYQNRNALEIAKQGGALYDKFVSFVDNLVEVGKSMDKSKANYEEAMKKLATGKGNLINKSESLKKLGAKTSKTMSNQLIERSEN